MRNKILVVDDDGEFLTELSDALRLSGFDVETAGSGAAALRRIARRMPDLVLLDLKMDGQSGFAVANDLKHRPATERIPIIAMTGHYTKQEHARLMDICGIDLCLTKPIVLQELISRIELLIK